MDGYRLVVGPREARFTFHFFIISLPQQGFERTCSKTAAPHGLKTDRPQVILRSVQGGGASFTSDGTNPTAKEEI